MSDSENKNLISLEEATKFCNYSQEYLSLRARRKKLKSVKVGRVWMTTKEWLGDYLSRVEEYKNYMEEKRMKKNIVLETAAAPDANNPLIKIERKLEIPIPLLQDDTVKAESLPVPELAVSNSNAFNNLDNRVHENKAAGQKPIAKNYFSYAYDKNPHSKNSGFAILFSVCFFLIFISIFSRNFLANLFSDVLFYVAEPAAFSINEFAFMADESFSFVSNDIGLVIKRNPAADNFVSSAGYSLNYTKDTFGQYFAWLYKKTKDNAFYAQQKAAASVSFIIYPFKIFTGYTENILLGRDNHFNTENPADPKLFKELNSLKGQLNEIKNDIDNISKNIPLK